MDASSQFLLSAASLVSTGFGLFVLFLFQVGIDKIVLLHMPEALLPVLTASVLPLMAAIALNISALAIMSWALRAQPDRGAMRAEACYRIPSLMLCLAAIAIYSPKILAIEAGLCIPAVLILRQSYRSAKASRISRTIASGLENYLAITIAVIAFWSCVYLAADKVITVGQLMVILAVGIFGARQAFALARNAAIVRT